ncbi:MAG: hypothetical protein PWP27_1567 [Clostridiales bacterium]|jgi:membrane peptidoglycan carboxypeptidase|nr:hypothetical protein [Clostridiales bacterium]MDK2933757.1 hypothetical protein [Clostridiales bacterium]
MLSNYNKYFKDSYGWDKFSKFLLYFGVILLVVKHTAIGGIVVIAYAFWRSISKDKYKRYQEKLMFEEWLRKLNSRYYKIKQKFMDIRQKYNENRKYRIVSCPKCSTKLRLPKNKGRIIATCRICHAEFRMKT